MARRATYSLAVVLLAVLFLTGNASTSTHFFVPNRKVSTTRVATPAIALQFSGGNATPTLNTPQALYENAVTSGATTAASSVGKIFSLSVVAGAHVAFGAYLALTIGMACPGIAMENPGIQKMILGAFGLPLGILMSVMTGGELFTTNAAFGTAALIEGKASAKGLITRSFASFTGNVVGALLLAYLAHASGTLGAGPASAIIASAKCTFTWRTAFIRGLLCNWLVCTAIYVASGCATESGKAIAVWFPVSAFVALGFDHSVANMFFIPLGMLRGADVTIAEFVTRNLIPVTLGNILGGAFGVMAPFGLAFGQRGEPK